MAANENQTEHEQTTAVQRHLFNRGRCLVERLPMPICHRLSRASLLRSRNHSESKTPVERCLTNTSDVSLDPVASRSVHAALHRAERPAVRHLFW